MPAHEGDLYDTVPSGCTTLMPYTERLSSSSAQISIWWGEYGYNKHGNIIEVLLVNEISVGHRVLELFVGPDLSLGGENRACEGWCIR